MFRKFLTLFVGYTLLVILLGAYVRATGSGAGCGSHWPLCNGDWVPRNGAEKTWIEYSHRISSGLCWLFALLGVVWARRAHLAGHPVRTWSWLVLGFMSTEALIGAGVVIFERVAEDASFGRAYWMGAHLVNTFFLLASLAMCWCHAHWVAERNWLQAGREQRPLFLTWVAALLAFLLVGMSGAVAALGDTLFPAGSVVEGLQGDFSLGAHAFVQLRIFHPLLAFVGAGLVICFSGYLAGSSAGATRVSASAVLFMTLTQLALGALNVLLLAPVWMQLVHLLVADVLWLSLLVTGFAVFRQPQATAGLRIDSSGEGVRLSSWRTLT